MDDELNRRTGTRGRSNQYRKVSVLLPEDYIKPISGNNHNTKIGDQDLLISVLDFSAVINSLITRSGEGTLVKGTHSIPFDTPIPAGSSLHIDFKATNATGNVGSTIIIGVDDAYTDHFNVKVDLNCNYTYVAHLI